MDHVGSGIVPVVQDILSRKLIGVITDRDLCLRVMAPGLYPAHTWARDCMTPHPICCHADDSAETALRQMRDQQVRRLPVVDERMRLLGMVSISDFVRTEAVDVNTVYDAIKQICRRSTEASKPEPLVSSVA
jgi:CBS domain-containing protein